MGAALLGNTHVVDAMTGRWINQKHQALAELINDFDPNLFLVFFEPGNNEGDHRMPYAVIHVDPKHPEPYYIFYLNESEVDQPEKVMAMLFESRRRANGKPGELADWLEDQRRAAELVKAKATVDEDAERRDKATFLWKTGKHDIIDGRREDGMFNRIRL